MGYFLGFSSASHLPLSGSESVFGIPRDPPMCLHISVKMDSTAEAYESSKELSSQEGLPDLRMKNMRSLIFYLGRAQPLLSIVLESVHRE